MECLRVAFAVLLGVIFAAALLTEEQHDEAKRVAESCHQELGGELPENYSTRMSHELLTLTSETAKCHVHCFYRKIGVINEDGTINRLGVIAVLSKGNSVEKAQLMAALCDNRGGETKCERAYNIYQCYHTNKSILDD